MSLLPKESVIDEDENVKSLVDILGIKARNGEENREDVRMVSYIDSKPMQPYISLLPLKNFLKKEQEFSRKGALGDGMSSGQGYSTSEGTGQINWSRLLVEELGDLMKRKEEELNTMRKRQAKEKKESENKRVALFKAQSTNPTLKRREFQSKASPFTSIRNIAQMRGDQSKPNKLSAGELELGFKPRKVISLQQPIMTKSNTQGYMEILEEFAQIHMDNMKKILTSESLDNCTNETKYELIRLFFEEIPVHSGKVAANDESNADFSSTNRRLSTKPVEEMDEHELEELEEIKKKEKMKLDQELIEFKKKGGFAKVLHDLFYNPDPNSLEFDSVYKLKQLCIQYYQKKGKLGKQLLETLDVLMSDRPFTMKSK